VHGKFKPFDFKDACFQAQMSYFTGREEPKNLK